MPGQVVGLSWVVGSMVIEAMQYAHAHSRLGFAWGSMSVGDAEEWKEVAGSWLQSIPVVMGVAALGAVGGAWAVKRWRRSQLMRPAHSGQGGAKWWRTL